MTQRSILKQKNQTIIIKVGASVTVKGHYSDLVTADTKGIWGLTLERRAESQIGRAPRGSWRTRVVRLAD